MENEIYKLIITLAISLLSIIFSYIIRHLDHFLKNMKEKAIKTESSERRTDYIEAITDLKDVTKTTVCALEQVLGKKIKKSIRSGKGNRNDLKDLSVFALDKITHTIGEKKMGILHDHLGSVDDYIKDLIEENVFKLKKDI